MPNKIKQILSDLTFGFELEGYFKADLEDAPTVDGEFKEDGSVHITNPFTRNVHITQGNECPDCEGNGNYASDDECDLCNGTGYYERDENEMATEYASQVFAKPSHLYQALSVFNIETFATGRGCGFHLHIGAKNQELRIQIANAAANFHYLNNLRAEAVNWCTCMRSRLTRHDNHYYQRYEDNDSLVVGFQKKEKYHFLHFHPEYGTLEFRFLAPCEHKVDNAKKLIQSLTKHLASVFEQSQESTIKILEPIQDTINITVDVLPPEVLQEIAAFKKQWTTDLPTDFCSQKDRSKWFDDHIEAIRYKILQHGFTLDMKQWLYSYFNMTSGDQNSTELIYGGFPITWVGASSILASEENN